VSSSDSCRAARASRSLPTLCSVGATPFSPYQILLGGGTSSRKHRLCRLACKHLGKHLLHVGFGARAMASLVLRASAKSQNFACNPNIFSQTVPVRGWSGPRFLAECFCAFRAPRPDGPAVRGPGRSSPTTRRCSWSNNIKRICVSSILTGRMRKMRSV
jgi:hypothetical protein